jgi:predicted N-acetyltransferase YhbS
VNEAAFGEASEADLVDKLRGHGSVLVSLVAEFESAIVSHVLFSRMSIPGPDLYPPSLWLLSRFFLNISATGSASG